MVSGVLPGRSARAGTTSAASSAARSATLLGKALWWPVAAAVATVCAHLTAAFLARARPVGSGEAALVAATALARGVRAAAGGTAVLGDRFAAAQLAAAQTALPLSAPALVTQSRWACLVVTAVAALLLWAVLRGLGLPAPAAAAGVIALGVATATTPVLAAPVAVVALGWLCLGGAVAARGGRLPVVALVPAAVATVVTPLAGAAVLAGTAWALADGTVRVTPRSRTAWTVVAGAAAAALTVAYVLVGQLRTVAADDPGPVVAAIAGVVVLLLGAPAWRVARWARPLLVGGLPALAVLCVPGPPRGVALVLLLPIAAVAVAVLVDAARRDAAARRATAVVTAGVTVAGVVAVAAAAGVPAPPPSTTVATWAATALAPGTAVRADALARAEIDLSETRPDLRLLAPGTAAPGALDVVTDRAGVPCAVADIVALGTSGGAPATVCRTDGAGPAVASERADRARLGTALAGNPALALDPAAAAVLRSGDVDPRVMLVLATVAADHRITVAAFPTDPSDAPGAPRRAALLTTVDGAPAATTPLLPTWLAAQQQPFAPMTVGPAGTDLLLRWTAPPPPGLVPR
ncbi:MAG: hypothetical protein ABS81_07345 [Pseudonocardia sp. SCN 72-86]|nr:MAG: hypothetical protein ABS81_07345 [Pseudonocardia sp. SCN 72-86]